MTRALPVHTPTEGNMKLKLLFCFTSTIPLLTLYSEAYTPPLSHLEAPTLDFSDGQTDPITGAYCENRSDSFGRLSTIKFYDKNHSLIQIEQNYWDPKSPNLLSAKSYAHSNGNIFAY